MQVTHIVQVASPDGKLRVVPSPICVGDAILIGGHSRDWTNGVSDGGLLPMGRPPSMLHGHEVKSWMTVFWHKTEVTSPPTAGSYWVNNGRVKSAIPLPFVDPKQTSSAIFLFQ